MAIQGLGRKLNVADAAETLVATPLAVTSVETVGGPWQFAKTCRPRSLWGFINRSVKRRSLAPTTIELAVVGPRHYTGGNFATMEWLSSRTRTPRGGNAASQFQVEVAAW